MIYNFLSAAPDVSRTTDRATLVIDITAHYVESA
jgi:hypothetical protein